MGKIVESIEKDKKASKESFDAGIEIIRSPEFFQTWQTICKSKTIRLEELDSLNFPKKIHDNILLLFSILLVAVWDMSASDPRRLHLDRIEAYDYAKKCGKNPKVDDYTELEFEGSPDEYLFKCKYYDRSYMLLLTVEQGIVATLVLVGRISHEHGRYGLARLAVDHLVVHAHTGVAGVARLVDDIHHAEITFCVGGAVLGVVDRLLGSEALPEA